MKFQKIIYALASLAILLIIWQISSELGITNPQQTPGPLTIAKAIAEWAKSGELLMDFTVSISRGMLGLAIGCIIGIILGLLTGRNQRLNLLLAPPLNILRAAPPVALLPVFITFFGISEFSKIFSIAFATVFPMWVNTHSGASNIPIEFLRSAKLLTKSNLKIFWRVVLPASLNSIVAGFRISLAMSFIMMYVSELAGASQGLGYQIANSHAAYRYDRMFGALFVLGITATLIDMLLNGVIRRIFPWVKANKVM